MATYSELKTPRWQRIVIWVIALALAVGTVAGFVAMMFGKNSDEITAEQQEKYQAELTAKTDEHQKKVDAQNAELSKNYYPILNEFRARVSTFEPTGIGDVKTEDLRVGDGAEITAENGADYAMYYIGWKPDGAIFDSSFNENSEVLKSPLSGAGQYIAGWNEGVVGMKIGGVREITIPADKAYGADGSGCDENKQNCQIAPDTPLKFVVFAVKTPDEIPYPKGTLAACEKAYVSAAAQYGATAAQLCEAYGISAANEEK